MWIYFWESRHCAGSGIVRGMRIQCTLEATELDLGRKVYVHAECAQPLTATLLEDEKLKKTSVTLQRPVVSRFIRGHC